MKKVICMVMAIGMILSMTACNRKVEEPSKASASIATVAGEFYEGIYPMESYLEYHEHDGHGMFCSGLTFKGWEHY